MKLRLTPASLLLLSLTLSACTGTDETPPLLRLALLTDGGSTLRLLTPGADNAPVTGDVSLPVAGGVGVNTLPSGRTFALTRAAGVEARGSDGAVSTAFAAPAFAPCLKTAVTTVTRDRVLVLSDCPNDAQRLALYRAEGTLIWTALLPTFLPPAAGTDVPPIRMALLGDVALVARPSLDGGSETMRVAAGTGEGVARVSEPRRTAAIRDLAAYSAAGGITQIVAATDTGVHPLNEAGEPDLQATLKAFGSARYDRVWTAGSRPLIAAWRDNRRSNVASEALKLWDGRLDTAATVDSNVADLRDVTLTPDGLLYALSATGLTRYDTVFGLNGGSWKPRQILSGLNDARSLTWLVP